jgi:hypothetical protein
MKDDGGKIWRTRKSEKIWCTQQKEDPIAHKEPINRGAEEDGPQKNGKEKCHDQSIVSKDEKKIETTR